MLTILSDPTNAQRIQGCLRSQSVEMQKTYLNLPLSTVWQKLNYLPAWSNVNPQLQLFAPMADNPTVCLHDPKSTPKWLLFQIFKFSGPSLPGMTSFTLQPFFLSGVYYDNFDCYILCARAKKLFPMSVHLN